MSIRSLSLQVPEAILRNVPGLVKDELYNLSEAQLDSFVEAFKRKKKSVVDGYVLWACFGCHYLYLRRWGAQLLFWLTFGGIVLGWVIDFFRIPGLIRDYNKDVAITALKDIKAISGS